MAEKEEVRNQREAQRHGVDGDAGEVLSEHDFQIACRNGQQQFVGSLAALVGPNTHCDGRHEEEQDEGYCGVQCVQVGQVGAEEFARPERGTGAQQQENANEDIARRIGEIVDEVSLEYSTEDVGIHVFSRTMEWIIE